ncbi:hypothetical protein SAMN02745216_05267 [Desulfatibacillum alkenivorans DSM 16219]|uniref:Uncharacterized protein n=1 Tax=Desulfatibacillum alkenivorans DSM 16219 TaxID=1121393 RepID=A0A1M7B3D0_9BACT|nr:hypothetical protein [Desulfatibacillum alkenivorans]SHL49386.1 hypothetical protein SAMN02745216_05267 [Desulfatibacillum alkenivorans DSM 16219]
MNAKTKKDRRVGEALIGAILKGGGFSGFRFDTAFCLRFERSEPGEINGNEIPWIFELQILTEWWFGAKEDWKKRVKSFQEKHCLDTDEPLKAYELTCLRWSEGGTVDLINMGDNCLTIVFKNGKSLSISLESDVDFAWIVQEPNVSEEDSQWSVVCECGELFVRMPYS